MRNYGSSIFIAILQFLVIAWNWYSSESLVFFCVVHVKLYNFSICFHCQFVRFALHCIVLNSIFTFCFSKKKFSCLFLFYCIWFTMVEIADPTTETPVIESTSLLYIHPSACPDATLVLIPFDGVCYRSWRRGVRSSLTVKSKLAFINGECKNPSSIASTHRQRKRCDNMVTSWILNSLSKDIVDN